MIEGQAPYRLYALPLTRIVELTDDSVRRDQGRTYLAVDHHPFVRPPKLAASSTISRSPAPGTATPRGADTSCPVTALDARATPSASPTP